MPNISRAAKRQNIVLVIATLLEHGPIVSDKGEAFHDLYLLCKKAGVLWEYATALRTLVNKELLSQGIAQVTERVGARGYTRIELLAIPSEYEDEVQEFLNKRETVPVPLPLPEPERTPEPMPIAAVYDGPTADEVANSILNRVMEIHNRPAQYEIKEQRLREALEQRDASVRRASDYRDDLEVASKRIEAQQVRLNSLQAELRRVEENLKAALSASRFAVDEQVQREVKKLMVPSNGRQG